jgi:hypothetical protein
MRGHNRGVVLIGQILFFALRDLPWVLLAAVAVGAAVLWLYPPQVRGLGRPWRWAIPALRAAALGALVVSILKPVAARPKSAAERGAVVVLVDRSASMGVSDVGRSDADKVALADGLGMLPAGVRSDPVQGLLGELDRLRGLCDDLMRTQRELEIARLAGQGVEAARRRMARAAEAYHAAAGQLIARAPEMAAESKLRGPLSRLLTGEERDEVEGNRRGRGRRDDWGEKARDRIAAAERAAESYRTASDQQLYQQNAAVRSAADAAGALSRFQLVERALTGEQGVVARLEKTGGGGGLVPLYGYGVAGDLTALPLRGAGRPVKRLLVTADGDRTDLTHNVAAALDQMKGAAVRGIVLFSDGRQVGGDSTVPSALSATGVPVFAVAAAPRRAPADLSIAQATAPQTAFVGETITVRVTVRSTDLPAGEVKVHLKQTGGAGAEQVQTAAAPANGVAAVEFAVKLEKGGAQRLDVGVEERKGEISAVNNHVSRWVKVLSQKMQVGFYGGWGSWDFQYIRNALSRTPWVALSDAILGQGATLPLSPERIEQLDLLILSDVAPEALSDGQWNAVQQLVKDRGGSVMLLAGSAAMPTAYAQRLLLKELLPFPSEVTPVWRSWPGEAAYFHLVPGAGARGVDAMKLSDDPAEPRWPRLAAVYHYLSIPQLKPNVSRVLLMERDSQAPVLTESRLGLGRVFFFGANETWRWRQNVGERDQDRFWLQLFRYAAEAPYAAQAGGMSLDVDRVALEPGGAVHVRAKVIDGRGHPSSAEEQRVELLAGAKVVRTARLGVVGASGSGRYEGMISELPAGDYELRLVGEGGKKGETGVSLPLHVARSDEAEMADLSSDYGFLRRLARSSGGQLLTLEQVGRLPEKLREAGERRSQRAERPLWDSGWLFGFVLACLACEWGLRKRFGLS